MNNFDQREEIVMSRIMDSFGRRLEKVVKLVIRNNIKLAFDRIVDWLFSYPHLNTEEYKNELEQSLIEFLDRANTVFGENDENSIVFGGCNTYR